MSGVDVLQQQSFDAASADIVDRHLRAAGEEVLHRSDDDAVRAATAALIRRWQRAGKDDALRDLFAELFAAFFAFFDDDGEAIDSWDTADGQLRRLWPLTGGDTTDFAALLALSPPSTPRYQRWADAVDAESERRRRDESGY